MNPYKVLGVRPNASLDEIKTAYESLANTYDISNYQGSSEEPLAEDKISELNTICNKMITSGVDVEIDGKTEHFSYTIEDQANIDDIAQMAKSTNMEQSYHCDNGSCKLYTVEEITKIYMTQKMNKAHNITYANQLKLYVKSLKEKAEVESIAYGQDLTGEYLNTYNTIMEHEQSVAKAFIATE